MIRGTFFLLFLAYSLVHIIPVSAAEERGDTISTEALMRGERLFYGLVGGKFGDMACADCHNTMEIDTFNWNPNAWEIAHKYRDRPIEEFRKAVLDPTGPTMSRVHQTFSLTEAEVTLIKFFLDEFEQEGLAKRKPVINKIFLFFLLGVVLTWIVLDVIFIKKVRRRWILGILFVAALGWQIKLLYEAGTALGRQHNYEPDQPVKFSHVVHVADNLIECQYCHNTVGHARTAGIPAMGVCWNCHVIVREGTHAGRHEISKVVEAYDRGQPIQWIRIHNLQDHVLFNHAQHVTIAEIECATCHGPVEEMHRVRQVSDLSMGWCVNCHRDTEVQFLDNTFYEQYAELSKKVLGGEIDRVTADMVGGTECSKCHY